MSDSVKCLVSRVLADSMSYSIYLSTYIITACIGPRSIILREMARGKSPSRTRDANKSDVVAGGDLAYEKTAETRLEGPNPGPPEFNHQPCSNSASRRR